jgi:hypothetical protein
MTPGNMEMKKIAKVMTKYLHISIAPRLMPCSKHAAVGLPNPDKTAAIPPRIKAMQERMSRCRGHLSHKMPNTKPEIMRATGPTQAASIGPAFHEVFTSKVCKIS